MKVVGSNLAELYKVVDTSILPDDYLPDDHRGPSAGPVSKIIGTYILYIIICLLENDQFS